MATPNNTVLFWLWILLLVDTPFIEGRSNEFALAKRRVKRQLFGPSSAAGASDSLAEQFLSSCFGYLAQSMLRSFVNSPPPVVSFPAPRPPPSPGIPNLASLFGLGGGGDLGGFSNDGRDIVGRFLGGNRIGNFAAVHRPPPQQQRVSTGDILSLFSPRQRQYFNLAKDQPQSQPSTSSKMQRMKERARRNMLVLQQLKTRNYNRQRAPTTVLPPPAQEALDTVLRMIDSGRDRRVSVDTSGQDRFVVNHVNGVKLFGLPIAADVRRRGWEWNDGNFRFVNDNRKSLLGQDVDYHSRGATVPMKDILDFVGGIIQQSADVGRRQIEASKRHRRRQRNKTTPR